MGLPAEVGYGRVVGRLIRAVLDGPDVNETPDGVPITNATVTFTADITHARNQHTDPPVTIFFDPVVVGTDSDGMVVTRDGQPGVWLVATDDADIDPMIGAYTVTVAAPSTPRLSWRIQVPAGETVDLSTAVPVPSNPTAQIAEWERVRAEVIQARDEAVQAADGIPGLVAVAVDELAGPLVQATVETQVPPAVASEVASAVVPHVQAAEAAAGDAVDARDAINQLQITASASTLDAGESATAVMSGTTPEMTLALGIPRGPKGDAGTTTWAGITDKPDVIAAGATQSAARTAIGAGTSDLTLGTTSTTAMRGDTAIPAASSTTPADLAAAAAVGSGTTWARADHAHKRPTLAELGAAASTHTHVAGDVTGGVFAPARLGSGAASVATVLRGDGSWGDVPGMGDVAAALNTILNGE